MDFQDKNKTSQAYPGLKMKIDGKESDIKMYMVLDKELTAYNGFQLEPGRWNEVSDMSGLPVYINKPNYRRIHYMPNHTYLVEEVEKLLGDDGKEVRYKRVKISAQPLSLDDLIGKDKKGFSGAYLPGADLSQAYLYYANLSVANLSKANLSEAGLYEADFFGSNLSGAKFHGAYLSEADFHGSNYYEADFSNAHGVKNISNKARC